MMMMTIIIMMMIHLQLGPLKRSDLNSLVKYDDQDYHGGDDHDDHDYGDDDDGDGDGVHRPGGKQQCLCAGLYLC